MEVLVKHQRLELAARLQEIKEHPAWKSGVLRLAREVKEGILVEVQDANPGDLEIRSPDGGMVEIRTFNTRMLLRKGQIEGIDKLFQAFDMLLKELEGGESGDGEGGEGGEGGEEEKPLPVNLDAENEEEMDDLNKESDLPLDGQEV